jgi:hypothetical protein
MSSFQLPPIDGLQKLSAIERAAVLDALFEPCTALHTLSLDLLHTETFDSYYDLIASVGVQLTDLSESPSTSDTEWLYKILSAHPRLGEKKVESAQSKAEQAQLNTGNEEEATRLWQLNMEYEKAFPGLRYVYEAPRLLSQFQELTPAQRVRERQIAARNHGGHASKDSEGRYHARESRSYQGKVSRG